MVERFIGMGGCSKQCAWDHQKSGGKGSAAPPAEHRRCLSISNIILFWLLAVVFWSVAAGSHESIFGDYLRQGTKQTQYKLSRSRIDGRKPVAQGRLEPLDALLCVCVATGVKKPLGIQNLENSPQVGGVNIQNETLSCPRLSLPCAA